ncbi:hypothetical protein INT45_007990 [Circinella minor]|uniref:Uncharacterized protein n=1 Tax=Circinella minor TaxID=1195481 RepID=A0A8H7S1Z4_9FUNG|nr:hypothetical protein INT45_007990 [Circinella minor]
MISEQQHYRRKNKQYPPSIPAATLLATDSYPYVKRRIPVAPLIRLSGIDRLSYQQQQLYQPFYSTEQQQQPRPQTPPPAYAGTLPPRYEEVVVINHSDDDNIPLVQLQQQQKYLDKTIIIDDEYETLDRVQQRLKSTAYNK